MPHGRTSATTVYVALLTIIFAAQFSAFFVAGSGPSSEVFTSVASASIGKLCVLVVAAVWAYRRKVNQSTLLLICFVCAFITFGFTIINVDNLAVRVAMGLAIGLLDGTSLAYSSSLLAGLSRRHLLTTLCLGFAAGSLISPLAREFLGIGSAQIGLISIMVFLACAFILFMRQGSQQQPENVEQRIAKMGTPILADVFRRRRTVLYMLAGMALFTFCFGVLEVFLRAHGHTFASSSYALVIASAMAIAFLALSNSKPLVGRFNAFAFAVVFALLLLDFVVLITAPYSDFASIFSSAAFVLLNMILFILVAQSSNEDGISPTFAMCAVGASILFVHMLGQTLAFTLLYSAGLDYEIIPRVASVIAGVAASGLAVHALRVAWISDNQARAEDTSEETSSEHDDVSPTADAAFDSFCDAWQLSKREREIVWWYSRGPSVKAIASKLHLSETTVRSYIQHVYTKTGLHSKQELIEAIEKYDT